MKLWNVFQNVAYFNAIELNINEWIKNYIYINNIGDNTKIEQMNKSKI